MKKIEIKNILIIVLVLVVVGIVLYCLNSSGNIHIPSTIDLKGSGPLLLGLVALYFILGFAILYLLFQPKGAGQVAAVAGASILWGIF